MLTDAESAAYTACEACFKEFQDLDRRTLEWEGKVKAHIDKVLASRGAAAKESGGPGSSGRAAGSVPPLPAPQMTIPAAPAEPANRPRRPAGTDVPMPRVLVVSLAALAALLVAWTLGSRRKGRPPRNSAGG
jgi:hypothetical protein